MKTNTPRFLILSSFFFLFSYQIVGQINLQVGYGLGLADMEKTEQILLAYRRSNPSLSGDFKKIRYYNTFIVGLRQSWRGVSLGLQWKYRPVQTGAEGTDLLTNQNIRKDFYFNVFSYSLGVETGGKCLQLGTSLDYNSLIIKEKMTGYSDKRKISREHQWGSQFYINYNFSTGPSNQITLQAFYFMPWSEFDLSSFQSYLQVANDPKRNKESHSHFGLSLILSNGHQIYN